MPLWTDIVIAIAAGLTVVILLSAALYARHEIKCIERTREAQLLTDLSRRWDEEQLQEARKAANEYDDGNKLRNALQDFQANNDPNFYKLMMIPDFFEELGLLVNSTCLNLQLANDLFGTAINHHYVRYEPSIKYLRDKYKDDNLFKFFSQLA